MQAPGQGSGAGRRRIETKSRQQARDPKFAFREEERRSQISLAADRGWAQSPARVWVLLDLDL